MEQFDTYYNYTLHTIKTQWESWCNISSGKNHFRDTHDNYFKNTVTHGTNSITQNHPLLLTTTGRITYDDALSTDYSSYPKQEDFGTIKEFTNSLDKAVFNTNKTPEPQSRFTFFPSYPTPIQQSNARVTELAPYYEPLTNLYQSGFDFLFPQEKITKCAISINTPDRKQRLINFSARVRQDRAATIQLFESSGEVKCAQICTGERNYTSFLCIYQRYKYRQSLKKNATPSDQSQENVEPDLRVNQESNASDSTDNQEGNESDSTDNQKGNESDSADNQEGDVVDPRDNQEGNESDSTDNQESSESASTDNQEGAIVDPRDNQEGAVIDPSDNQEGTVVDPADNQEGAVVDPSDNREDNVPNPTDNQEGNASDSTDNQEGTITDPKDNQESTAVDPRDNREDSASDSTDNQEGSTPDSTNSQEGTITGPIDYQEGYMSSPTDNQEGIVVDPIDNQEGTVMDPVDNQEDNVPSPTDDQEGTVVGTIDNQEGAAPEPRDGPRNQNIRDFLTSVQETRRRTQAVRRYVPRRRGFLGLGLGRPSSS